MPTIVEKLQRDAVDPNVSVATLLRQVKVAAVKLRLPVVETWVEHELNGYRGLSEVPPYREIRGEAKAFNPYNGWVPLIMKTAELQKLVSERGCHQSVAELTELTSKEGDKDFYKMPFPHDVSANLRKGSEFDFSEFAIIVPRTELTRILDSVRDKVLNWALELERTGILGDEIGFSSEERERAQHSATIHIGSIGNYVGVMGSGNVAGDISASNLSIEKARDIVRQVREHQAELTRAGANGQELQDRLEKIEAALDAKTAPGVLKGLFMDLRNTVSGAAGNLVATGVLATLQPYLGALTS